MVSTRSGVAKNVGSHRRSTSPDFAIKTPRRNSLTPRPASVTPRRAQTHIAEPPPSSTKKSLSWGESPQWNADVSIAEGHYGVSISFYSHDSRQFFRAGEVEPVGAFAHKNRSPSGIALQLEMKKVESDLKLKQLLLVIATLAGVLLCLLGLYFFGYIDVVTKK